MRCGTRGELVAAPLILLLLLSFAGVAAQRVSGSAPSSIPLVYSAYIPDTYFEYYNIDAAAATNALMLASSANVSVSTALMNSAQFTAFNESDSEIVNSVYVQNGTSAQTTLSLQKGDYFLVLDAYSGNANISFNWELYPNSPYQTGPLPSPEPTGIGTFGITNDSGVVTPYTIESNEVVGVADISALQAHNSSASSAQSNISGATLQLNTVLLVNEQNGTQQSYWVQDTPDFVTSASQISYVDNIWNYSTSGYLDDNSSITSTDGGFTYAYQQNNVTQYFYAAGTGNFTYTLPLDVVLMLNETVEPGVGVLVQVGTQLLRNGTTLGGGPDWFDNATIHDPTVTTAYYYVAGNVTTPEATYYDTELVFGGEANGEATSFTQMSATLQLFYDSNTTNQLTYFPSYYGFGQDTAEAADNLQVSYNGNGIASVSTGTPSYLYLGGASGSTTLSQLAASASSSTTVQTSSSTSSSSGSGGVPVLPYQFAAAALFTVVLAASYLLIRRGAKTKLPRVSDTGS
ncbi:MAG: thermopsin [Thaumarchaeota archaeon]|nr:thermopsin [Nitrososphaerota archaeon]